MTIALGDRVLDVGLTALDTECDKIYVCSSTPTTFTEATSTFALGNKNFGAGAAFGAPAAGSPDGRKVTSVAITDGSVTTGGTVACWAAVDSSNSRLLATGSLSGGMAVTSGWIFTLGSFAVHLPKSSTGLDAATTAWINAVVAAGGTVSATQQSRVDALIIGLKADSLWTGIDRLWLFAGESVIQQAGIDIKNLGTHTIYGTLPLDVHGYGGFGGGGVIDSLLVPSAGGIGYVQDSACYGGYQTVYNDDGTEQMGCAIGVNNYAITQVSINQFQFRINSSTRHDATLSGTDSLGMWIFTRTGANSVAAYRNGSSVYTNNADASSSVPTGSLGIFDRHDGAGNNFSGGGTLCKYACWFMGAGLTATPAANFSSRLNTYATAWGVNTY